MHIRIEEEIYTGTPREIMKQIWENSFDKAQFPDLEGYIRHLCEAFTRMTDVPCKKEPDIEAQAKELLMALADIDALEVLSNG